MVWKWFYFAHSQNENDDKAYGNINLFFSAIFLLLLSPGNTKQSPDNAMNT